MKSASRTRPNRRAHGPGNAGPGNNGAAGFSLVELLVTLLVVAEILIIASLMFDLHNKTARAQNQVADMQQSLRVAQREMVEVIRMAGRGGLVANLPITTPGGAPPIIEGLAIEVQNNVPAGTLIVADDEETAVVPGTDVLRVRGVFTAPLYQLVSSALETGPNLVYAPTSDNPATAESGTVVINDPSPSGFPQSLDPLIEAAESAQGSAMILVSPLSDAVYGVVSLDGIVADDEDAPTQVTITFLAENGDATDEYRTLFPATGNLPDNLTGAAYVGLLEEHVFYIREVRAIPGDAASELMPRLARTRVFPRTDTGMGENTSDHTFDIADNVLDLQIALGYNSSADGEFFTADEIDEMVLVETADGAADDWLFNGAGDDPEAAPWVGPWSDAGTPQPQLQYVRLATLVRTEGREVQYVSPPIERIEDRVYDEPRVPVGRDPDRAYHRRLLRTVVDLRNL